MLPPPVLSFLKKNWHLKYLLSNNFKFAGGWNSHNIEKTWQSRNEAKSGKQGGVSGWAWEPERQQGFGKVALDQNWSGQTMKESTAGQPWVCRWGLKAYVPQTFLTSSATCHTRQVSDRITQEFTKGWVLARPVRLGERGKAPHCARAKLKWGSRVPDKRL